MAEAMLCQVCADHVCANVFANHYGANTCDSCTEFFIHRSSLIPPCEKKQQCIISLHTRNDCQFCRFKKCVAVGMSRCAARIAPKGKRKIIATKHPSQAHFFIGRMTEFTLMISIERAHKETYPLIKEKVATVLQETRTHFTSQLFGPLNLASQQQLEHYCPIYRNVVDFAMRIPGFDLLSQEDRCTLMQNRVFQVLFVWLSRIFNSGHNCLHGLNGHIIPRGIIHVDSRAEHLNTMYITAKKINNLKLFDHDMAIFCSVILVIADLPGLKDQDAVSSLRKKLLDILKKFVPENHPENPNIIQNLMEIVSSLTYLSIALIPHLRSVGETESGNNQRELYCRKTAGISDTSVTDYKTNSTQYLRDISQNNLFAHNLRRRHSSPEKRSDPTIQSSSGNRKKSRISTDSKDNNEVNSSIGNLEDPRSYPLLRDLIYGFISNFTSLQGSPETAQTDGPDEIPSKLPPDPLLNDLNENVQTFLPTFFKPKHLYYLF